MATLEKSALEGKVAAELHRIASDLGIEGHRGLKKADLIERILAHANGASAPATAERSERTNDEPAGREPARSAPTDAEGSVETAETLGNGGVTRQRERRDGPERREERPAPERLERRDADRGPGRDREGGGPGRDREGGRRRPSREERRRMREERRQREMEMREEELANAPAATGLLDILPE
ncbi:MAG TPA: Rho termination factor N-terminal domain-containing protein, partial [Actinomycetota bacterium]|nr:Rho termination factor N-terminal domain-containing protein [Actinomycetota bacterium]